MTDTAAPRGALLPTPVFLSPLVNPYGLENYAILAASPSAVDIDDDGDLDVLIGDFFEANIRVFINTAGPVAPVASTTASGAYGVGSVITLKVAFNEKVFVNTSGGKPTLTLETGAVDRLATYVSGSGTNTLTFRYTVKAGDSSADLDFISASALALNGSTIQDAAGNNAVLTLAAPGAKGSLGANAALVIDGVGPGGTLLSPEPAFQGAAVNPYGLGFEGYKTSPSFADIDADGDLDVFFGGKFDMLMQLNTGTASNPAFGSYSTDPYEFGHKTYDASPVFFDIDGDGDLDAFVGEWYGGIRVYLNTGTASNPAFGGYTFNSYGLRDVGFYANPTLIDIDADSDLDAFFGNGDGNTFFHLNTGTVTRPAFASATVNPYGLSDVGTDANPAFADIDNDGDLDALIGNGVGNTLLYLNTGTISVPAFASPVTNPYGLGVTGQYAKPNVVDIDGDGDLDALIGVAGGNTHMFINAGSYVAPVNSITANGIYRVGSVITLTVAFNENALSTPAAAGPPWRLKPV